MKRRSDNFKRKETSLIMDLTSNRLLFNILLIKNTPIIQVSTIKAIKNHQMMKDNVQFHQLIIPINLQEISILYHSKLSDQLQI